MWKLDVSRRSAVQLGFQEKHGKKYRNTDILMAVYQRSVICDNDSLHYASLQFGLKKQQIYFLWPQMFRLTFRPVSKNYIFVFKNYMLVTRNTSSRRGSWVVVEWLACIDCEYSRWETSYITWWWLIQYILKCQNDIRLFEWPQACWSL